MDLQDFLPSGDVGQIDEDLAVEAARSQQGRVQDVGPVGGGDDDHVGLVVEAIHLDQDLVKGLFALVVTAAQTGSALAADGIDLVDKDDRRRGGLGFLKQVSHAARPHSDEHLHELRAGYVEERHAGLAGHGAGQ